MNDKEINVGYDPEYKEGFVTNNMPQYHKIKMPEYYIAKHSDEDLQAAVAREREACAKICDDWFNSLASEPEMEKIAAEIRARGEK